MANFEICNLEDFLDNIDDEFITPDAYLQSLQPDIDETIPIPEEHIYQNSMQFESQKPVEGEITQLLRITPGILPPVNSFPKSYKPSKPAKLPDYIPNDRHNKIPILLNERYFKFHDGGDESRDDAAVIDRVNQNVREIVNNLDGNGSGSNNGNRKNVGRTDRGGRHNCGSSSINDGNNQPHSNLDDFEERFRSAFLDDTSESDEDNCNVRDGPDTTTHETQKTSETQPTVQPAQKPQQPQQYYNARQLYELKRGNKCE